MASVSIRAIQKGFPGKDRTRTMILKGIDLEIPDGSFTVLVGPSGCGKSTLLRTVAGLERQDEGDLEIGGRNVTKLEPRDRDIAMVFQSYALYPHLSVRDNLAFGLKLRGTSETDIKSRIAEVAPQLGLDPLLDRLPKQLSGGQRQRVAMGRAIVRRPSLFLFDEPLSNLDAALRGEVRIQIKRLHAQLKATMIYVTHDQVEAMTLADQLVVLNGGVIEQCGPPLDVYNHPKTKFVAGFLGMPPMNFLDHVHVESRAHATILSRAGLRIPMIGDHLKELRDVTVGIRPQDLRLHSGEDDSFAKIEVQAELVESLGFESYVHARIGETPFVIRLEAEQAAAVKCPGTLLLTVAGRDVHIFGKDGKAIQA